MKRKIEIEWDALRTSTTDYYSLEKLFATLKYGKEFPYLPKSIKSFGNRIRKWNEIGGFFSFFSSKNGIRKKKKSLNLHLNETVTNALKKIGHHVLLYASRYTLLSHGLYLINPKIAKFTVDQLVATDISSFHFLKSQLHSSFPISSEKGSSTATNYHNSKGKNESVLTVDISHQ